MASNSLYCRSRRRFTTWITRSLAHSSFVSPCFVLLVQPDNPSRTIDLLTIFDDIASAWTRYKTRASSLSRGLSSNLFVCFSLSLSLLLVASPRPMCPPYLALFLSQSANDLSISLTLKFLERASIIRVSEHADKTMSFLTSRCTIIA